MSKSRKRSSPNIPWPQSQDFNEAIQSPGLSFQDSVLKGGTVVLNPFGLPVVASGNFADVYKVNCSKTRQNWAVKCFTRQVLGRLEHYRHISAHLQQSRLSCFVEFQHLPQGIRVRGKWYPILKMEWYDGVTLNEFVRQSLSDSSQLHLLFDRWIELSGQLRTAQLAHGDLQHGNILVSQHGSASLDVKLVDYDGVYVPALAGTKPVESGHPAYQHPLRPQEAFSRIEVDNFPHLVIACALRALAFNGTGLWGRYDNGDNLLFTQQDFISPQDSPLFQQLWQSPDQLTRFLVAQLIVSADRPLGHEPFLADLLLKDTPPVVSPADEREVASILSRKSTKLVSQPNTIPHPSPSNKAATTPRPSSPAQKQSATVQATPTATRGPQPASSPARPLTVATKNPFPWIVATLVVVALLLTFVVRGFRNRANPTTTASPIQLTLIPAGEFYMGSPEAEAGREKHEGPQKRVSFTRPFYIGTYEVTQEQFDQVMGFNQSRFSSGMRSNLGAKDDEDESRFPVENVSWIDAIEFCNRLSIRHKRTPCYRRTGDATGVEVVNGNGFRLPTEAEWEYACRANTTTPYHCGITIDGDKANIAGINNYGNPKTALHRTTTVGSYPPNAFGLFDMHGNVAEWCWGGPDDGAYDHLVARAHSGVIDISNSSACFLSSRGGSWYDNQRLARSACREWATAFRDAPHFPDGKVGFRLVLVPNDHSPSSTVSFPITLNVQASASGVNEAKREDPLVVEMKWIPAGEFVMGSPATEAEYTQHERPTHRVVISRPFYLGAHEVTQHQYETVMGYNPSSFSPPDSSVKLLDTRNFPVEMVSWYDAIDFCNRMSEKDGFPPYYSIRNIQRHDVVLSDDTFIDAAEVFELGGGGYRLPTEAEWEYACRAGSSTPYHFGTSLNGKHANVDGTEPFGTPEKRRSLHRTTKVGAYPPNKFGLRDMHGNVSEMCWNWYDHKSYRQFSAKTAIDPAGPPTAPIDLHFGECRTKRGGSWADQCVNARAAARSFCNPSQPLYSTGFRLARSTQ